MGVRGLLTGIVMLALAAMFTMGLVTFFERRAMQTTVGSAELGAPAVAGAPRKKSDWMF